jgi:hypothetical protein
VSNRRRRDSAGGCTQPSKLGSVSCLLRGLGFAFDVFHFLDLYSGDAVSFHFFHRITIAFELERFAKIGNALQAGEYKSGEGFEAGVAGQEQAVLSFEIADVYRAFEQQDGLIG